MEQDEVGLETPPANNGEGPSSDGHQQQPPAYEPSYFPTATAVPLGSGAGSALASAE